MRTQHITSARLLAVLAAGAALGVASPAAMADPPGNNGTIKIDAQPFDDAPDNEPHVGCEFQVDFYGYDAGDYVAEVNFFVQPPTGKAATILTDHIFIGEDEAGGATDLDASATYELGAQLAAYTAHPKQGYHIKVVVNADGSIGADKKSKVFWVDDCDGDGGGGGST